ncbi:MAG: hypothetical protein AAF958_16695, partial [Planctomycetota bacterium]
MEAVFGMGSGHPLPDEVLALNAEFAAAAIAATNPGKPHPTRAVATAPAPSQPDVTQPEPAQPSLRDDWEAQRREKERREKERREKERREKERVLAELRDDLHKVETAYRSSHEALQTRTREYESRCRELECLREQYAGVCDRQQASEQQLQEYQRGVEATRLAAAAKIQSLHDQVRQLGDQLQSLRRELDQARDVASRQDERQSNYLHCLHTSVRDRQIDRQAWAKRFARELGQADAQIKSLHQSSQTLAAEAERLQDSLRLADRARNRQVEIRVVQARRGRAERCRVATLEHRFAAQQNCVDRPSATANGGHPSDEPSAATARWVEQNVLLVEQNVVLVQENVRRSRRERSLRCQRRRAVPQVVVDTALLNGQLQEIETTYAGAMHDWGSDVLRQQCEDFQTQSTADQARLATEQERLAAEKARLEDDEETLAAKAAGLAAEDARLVSEDTRLALDKETLAAEEARLETEDARLTTVKETLATEKESLATEKESLATEKESLATEKES